LRKVSPLSNKELLAEAISCCNSHSEILRYLGLRAAGGNSAQLKKYAKQFDLDLPVATGYQKLSGAHKANTINDELVFIANSTYSNRAQLKKRLRKIWTSWVCGECGIGEEWNGKSLVLQLDHINGIFNDHRLENLRLLCPNCHSQTDTFSGKSSNKCQDTL
jgi:hypothetical protein